jgi:Family of unknown function (DUF6188)
MDEHHNRQRREYVLIEYDDYWVIPLAGRLLSRVIVGYGLTLEFLDPQDEQISILIAGEFHLAFDNQNILLSHEQPTALGPALGLLARTVESARAYKDGRLELSFGGGSTISVAPADRYESWNVTGVRWLRIVCMPGGDLAVWKPDPPERDS